MKFETDDIAAIADAITAQIVAALRPFLVRPAEAEDRLLNVAEAAEMLGVKPSWVYRAVAAKNISYHKTGRFLKFSARELNAYISLARVAAINPPGADRRRK